MIKIIGYVIMMTNASGGPIEEVRTEYWGNYQSPRFTDLQECQKSSKIIGDAADTMIVRFFCMPIMEK